MNKIVINDIVVIIILLMLMSIFLKKCCTDYMHSKCCGDIILHDI